MRDALRCHSRIVPVGSQRRNPTFFLVPLRAAQVELQEGADAAQRIVGQCGEQCGW
ncbi:MAG: hypothetical protein IPM07_23890 [Anaerolineales bacterium]|nr:hypothetical protein [Anaerolineales bacterium]